MACPIKIEEPLRSTLAQRYRDGVLTIVVDPSLAWGTIEIREQRGISTRVKVPDEDYAQEVRRALVTP